jgi:hypothetical protein
VRAFASPYYKFVVVEPNYNKRYYQVDPGVRAEIRLNPHVAALLPVRTEYTYGMVLGIQQSYPLFAVSDDAMARLVTVTGTRLRDGRLPNARADEVALHEIIAKTRGLWIGSQIGRDVDSEDPIAGKWTVVGILEGDALLNLAPLDRVTKGRPANEILLIPRAGEMDALIADLNALATERVVVLTPAYFNEFIDRVLGQFDSLLTAINLVIIAVLSLGVGLLNLIYFRQRMGEFGLLAGIGYSRLFLVRRTALEALLLTVVAWFGGIALSALVYQILNVLVFEPQGTRLNLLNVRALGGTLPIPIFVWLFSTATVIWQLSRLDPVAVIDRRD